MPGSTMFVTEEHVVLGESTTQFTWTRLFTVLTTDSDGNNFGGIISFDASFPRDTFKDVLQTLRKSSTPNRHPRMHLPSQNPGTKQSIAFSSDLPIDIKGKL
jgi:hypothetical protein